MFKNSNTNKRYYTLDYYFKMKFGKKVAKISLDAGFTCPNIDGTKGIGGCSYCDITTDIVMPLEEQYQSIMQKTLNKWNDFKSIVYFQTHSNTYAPLSNIKSRFEQALSYENVVGICIATRADCLDDDIVDYLCELNNKTFLIVELGLQTIYDKTAEYINRCHNFDEFLVGYNKLKTKGINICVHLINGLPFETRDMMIETARVIGNLMPHSIKFHSLHIVERTKMAQQYNDGDFVLQTRDEYVQTVCDQIEVLHEDIVIQRVTGDGEKSKLIAPLWSLNKRVVQNSIDKELVRRQSYQGKYYQ